MKHLPIRFLNVLVVLVVLLPGAASAGTGLTAPKRSDLSSAQALATSRGSFVEATDSLNLSSNAGAAAVSRSPGRVDATSVVAAAKEPLDYFALGDSIAAGHGLMDDETPCRRSALSYPYKVLDTLWSKYTVSFPTNPNLKTNHFLACSGATAAEPSKAALAESRHKWLHNQFVDMLPLIRDDRLTLVSITIGANDFEWLDIPQVMSHLWEPEDRYKGWVGDVAGGVAQQLTIDLKELLKKHPKVQVVITEVHSPINERSLFFYRPNNSPCSPDQMSCYDKFEYGVAELNKALIGVRAAVGKPQQVTIATGIKTEFDKHRSSSPCGDRPVPKGTWVQVPGDAASNAAPLVPEWLSSQSVATWPWSGDCFHPNEAGAQWYADKVSEAFFKAAPALAALPQKLPAPPKKLPTPKPVAKRPGEITGFETWGAWKRGDEAWGTFTQSQDQVYAGSSSGKITYRFPAVSNNYLVFSQGLPIATTPAALKIMVFGDGSNNFLNAWVKDAKGLVWQFTFGRVGHTGWQPMVAPLDLNLGWPNGPVGHKGGGSPTYPLKFQALVLDGWREDTALQGVVYVDELFAGDALPIPAPAPTQPGPTVVAGPQISFRADSPSLTSGGCTTLRWDVDNARAVFLDGQGVGGHESRQVCPAATQTYRLSVTRQDGGQEQASVTIQVTAGGGTTPQPQPPPAGPCEAIPGESYGSLAIQGAPSDRPAEAHADANLSLRGYQGSVAPLQLTDYGPAVDPNGPQLPGLFGDQRVPTFTSSYRVNDWDWGCNCRGGPLATWESTLLGMGVSAGETLRVPDSGRSIGGGYEVLVLYASPDRITLKYTPEDNVVRGYTLHVEGVCVEPNLLGLYQSLDAAGRGQLPALRAGQAFGRAKGGEILVAIRGGGVFFDPRSRPDWWRGR